MSCRRTFIAAYSDSVSFKACMNLFNAEANRLCSARHQRRPKTVSVDSMASVSCDDRCLSFLKTIGKYLSLAAGKCILCKR